MGGKLAPSGAFQALAAKLAADKTAESQAQQRARTTADLTKREARREELQREIAQREQQMAERITALRAEREHLASKSILAAADAPPTSEPALAQVPDTMTLMRLTTQKGTVYHVTLHDYEQTRRHPSRPTLLLCDPAGRRLVHMTAVERGDRPVAISVEELRGVRARKVRAVTAAEVVLTPPSPLVVTVQEQVQAIEDKVREEESMGAEDIGGGISQ